MSSEKWTKDEEDWLIILDEQKVDMATIAIRIGKPVKSCTMKLVHLKLKRGRLPLVVNNSVSSKKPQYSKIGEHTGRD